MSFLKAEWRKLILVNYEVSPHLLQPLVPKHTEIDFWNEKCYVSLVGFLFQETKVKGIKFPFHINFEEVNLRFYVKHKLNNEIKRGVVFIKEIVPKPLIKFVANSIYNENYEAKKMKHNILEYNKQLAISYEWKNNNKIQSFGVVAQNTLKQCPKNSLEEFITEHYWGYNKKKNSTLAYEVKHPKWDIYPIQSANINVDFGATYGQEYDFLSLQKPNSIILAEGSEISVEHANKIKI